MHDNWEIVFVSKGNRVRRMPVPGGWLYQVESVYRSRTISEDFPSYEVVRAGWGQPLFVIDRRIAAIDRRDTVADDASMTRTRILDGRGSRAILFMRRAICRISGALRGCRRAMVRAIHRALPPE
jgi:hypothetical protein